MCSTGGGYWNKRSQWNPLGDTSRTNVREGNAIVEHCMPLRARLRVSIV